VDGMQVRLGRPCYFLLFGDFSSSTASGADGDRVGGFAEAAVLELRKKGLTAAGRKTSRAATDGLLAVANAEGVTAVVEINSETDFVARNEMFRHLVWKPIFI
jgi:hypothetical protein